MIYNAPYSGGFSPGAQLHSVDGDFTQCDPCGPPEISYPFKGDSFPGLKSIVLLDSSFVYQVIALGTGYNVQPFRSNQSFIVIEQEFMVAEQYYIPMRLNTPYWLGWSVGWTGYLGLLTNCFLVEEGPLVHVGGGIVVIKRKFASLPDTRNEYESYAYSFPALNNGTNNRFGLNRIVPSRVQYDYFVFDDLNILSIPLFNPSSAMLGRRLNATTGLFPNGIILEEQHYYKNGGASLNMQVDPDQPLVDGASPTNPSYTEYMSWVSGGHEIVAETSIFGPGAWMGNIYQRKTRFIVPR